MLPRTETFYEPHGRVMSLNTRESVAHSLLQQRIWRMASFQYNKPDFLSARDGRFARCFQENDTMAAKQTLRGTFWSAYLRTMEDDDEVRPKSWDGNMGSILTFTGLFAATVAAFLIESYKSLSRDPGDQTVILLTQLLAATTHSSSNASAMASFDEVFQPSLPAIITNALWFISLIVSLVCALLATLVQRWARDYGHDIKHRPTPGEDVSSYALNHAYIRIGVDRYGMDHIVNIIVGLIHLTVLLFFAGLMFFLYPINLMISACITISLGIFGLLYITAGLMPIYDSSCPYLTPLTYPCALIYSVILYFLPRSMICRLSTIMKRATQWLPELSLPCDVGMIQSRWASWRAYISELLSHLRKIEVIPIRRRRYREISDTMSSVCFRFMWRHTSNQLAWHADSEFLQILLQSTIEIIRSLPSSANTRLECLDHILGDGSLALRLDNIDGASLGTLKSSAETCLATLQLTCVLLRHSCETKKEGCALGYRKPIAHYFLALLSIIRTPQDTYHDRPTTHLVRARMSLFRLRWSLLLLSHGTPRSETGTGHSLIAKLNEIYFSTEPEGLWQLLVDHAVLEHPNTFLVLLNSWQYNRLDLTMPRPSRGEWSKDTSSCLLPLHDATCCRSRDGESVHVAACAILTFLVHVLHAHEHDREELLQDFLWEYGLLWEHRGFRPLEEWETGFTMNEVDRAHEPSPEFEAVLRDLGLSEWLAADNDLTYTPPLDTPHGQFLDYNDGMFSKALRKLRQCVSVGCSHVDPGPSFQGEGGAVQEALLAAPENVVHDEPSTSHVIPVHPRDDLSLKIGGSDLRSVIVDTVAGSASTQHYREQRVVTDEGPPARISIACDDRVVCLHEEIDMKMSSRGANKASVRNADEVHELGSLAARHELAEPGEG